MLFGPLTPDGNARAILVATVVEIEVEARMGVDPTTFSTGIDTERGEELPEAFLVQVVVDVHVPPVRIPTRS